MISEPNDRKVNGKSIESFRDVRGSISRDKYLRFHKRDKHLPTRSSKGQKEKKQNITNRISDLISYEMRSNSIMI